MNAAHAYSPLRRVSRRATCPICGKPDGCEISDDGAVHCLRVESPTPCNGRLGGWWHNIPGRRRPGTAPAAPAHPAPPTQIRKVDPPRADAGTLDAVYAALLEACPLSPADREGLLARTLPADTLGGYGTLLPLGQQRGVLAALEARFGRQTLLTVPGFVEKGEALRLALGGGLVLAVRGADGRIQALTTRQVDRAGKKSYIWLSSSAEGGPGSGSPAHLASPAGAACHTVLVTEGVIKAEIAASRLGLPAIGLIGHGVQAAGIAMLAELAERGAVCAIVAFDEDAKPETAALVAASRRKLADALLAMGFAVRSMRWDGDLGKGIDDLLVNGHTPRIELVSAAPAEPTAEDPGGTSRDRPPTTEEQAARYRILKNIIWSRDVSDPDRKARAADPGQKLALMVSYEFGGYPGAGDGGAVAGEKEVPLGVMATCGGMSRQTFASKLESCETAGLIRRTTETTNDGSGQCKTIVRIAPVRRLGFNEAIPEPRRVTTERERAQSRRLCQSCGSDAVRVELVQMERVTCTSCGAVEVDKPLKPRKFTRDGPGYDQRERERDYQAAVAAEEAEEEEAALEDRVANCTADDAGVEAPDRGKNLNTTPRTELLSVNDGAHRAIGPGQADPGRAAPPDSRVANCTPAHRSPWVRAPAAPPVDPPAYTLMPDEDF